MKQPYFPAYLLKRDKFAENLRLFLNLRRSKDISKPEVFHKEECDVCSETTAVDLVDSLECLIKQWFKADENCLNPLA